MHAEAVMDASMEALLALRDEPICASDGYLRACIKAAAALLVPGSTTGILRLLFSRHRIDGLPERITGLDHVGFVLPAILRDVLETEATAGGFAEHQHHFTSRIFARELSVVLGRDDVATNVFKASGTSSAGAPISIELFMPRDLEEGLWRDLAARGMSMHIGLALSRPEDFPIAAARLGDCGFQPPAAMPKPLTNAAEKVTAQYFDGPWQDKILRLELCYDATARHERAPRH